MTGKKRRKVIIGLETAVNGGSISLIENKEEIGCADGFEKFSRSEDVLKSLEKLLEKNNIDRKDIEKICVSKGPGSLTGIRIGRATAIGIANSLESVVFEISILDAMRINKPTAGNVIYAFSIGESVVYFKEFSERSKKNQEYQMGMDKITQISLREFVQFIFLFAKDHEVSMVLTENLVRAIEREVSVDNNFKTLSVLEIEGNLARIIGLACSSPSASDNK